MKNRNTLLGLFLIFSLAFTFAQQEISNKKTAAHQQIKGSKFFIIPPKGFTESSNFQGFQQTSTGASILVLEIPRSFQESVQGFTESRLKSQGVLLNSMEKITVNGHEGLFLNTVQSAYGKIFSKYILAFGNEKATYIVNGTFSKGAYDVGEVIKESMFSVVHEEELAVDPLSAVPFSIVTKNTKFKLAKNMPGTLLYTTDGALNPNSVDNTTLIVGLSLSTAQVENQREAAINRIKKLPYNHITVELDKIKPISIDGVSGYEIIGEGVENNTGNVKLIYQVMLFSNEGYYMIVGTTESEFEKNLALFKKVSNTFKRKQ